MREKGEGVKEESEGLRGEGDAVSLGCWFLTRFSVFSCVSTVLPPIATGLWTTLLCRPPTPSPSPLSFPLHSSPLKLFVSLDACRLRSSQNMTPAVHWSHNKIELLS